MTSTVAVLAVEFRGKDVNVAALSARLEARLKALDAAGVRTGAGLGGPLASGTRQAAGGMQVFSKAADAAKSNLLGMIGPAALVTGGLTAATAVVKSFADAFKFKADLDATTASINAQLKGVRDTGIVYAQASAFANTYKLTQKETTEAIAASIGVMRASKASVEDILSVLARLQVLSPEQSLQEAAIAIKALASGDTTSLVTRFEVGRDVAAQMKQEIAGGADAVAVMNTFLNTTGIGMDALAAKTKGAAGALKDVAIAQEELTLAQAQFAQGPGMVILNEQINVTRGLTRLLSGDFQAMADSALQAQADIAAANGDFASQAQILAILAERQQAATAAANANAAAQAAAASVAQQHNTVISLQSQAMIDASNAAQANATALVDQTQKTLDANIQSERLAQFQATLAQIGGAVAAGHLTAANGAAQLANMYGIATNAAFGLINAQAQLAGMKAPAGSAVDPSGQQHTNQLEAQANAYKKIRDAQEQQVISTGTVAQQQAVLNARLERARVTQGQLSVEYIHAQTALKQFQQQQDKPARGGRGGSGGVKLSDQQKLNNQLLADQERFGAKSEDLELKHGLKLLAIERDANEKRRAAAQAFQQNRLDTDASFYEQLGNIQDSGLQKAASDRFEAILLKGDEIARTKGADVAKEYTDAAVAGLQKETQLQAELNKALNGDAEGQGKDSARAEFLQGVLAKQQKANEERLRAIEENGSAIENERARQIADEERSFEESSGRIADQAETSAARRIAANERAGKAIDPERLAVQGLTTDYERLARAAGSRGGTAPGTTAGAAPAATTASPTEAATPTDLAALLASWQAIGTQITQAIAANERAVREGSSQVASAVGGRALV